MKHQQCSIKLHTVKEVADSFGVSPAFVYQAIHAGRLKAIKRRGTSRGLRVTDKALEEWYEREYEEYWI